MDANGVRLAEKGIDLLLEKRAVSHLVQIKEGQKLFLAVSLQGFTELQEQARSRLRVECAGSRLLLLLVLCPQSHTKEQHDESSRRAPTHVHRLLGRRRPPRSAGLP